MTKKFWKDWQKRQSDTKKIVLHQYLYLEPNAKTTCIENEINDIISLDFRYNKVKIEFRCYNAELPCNRITVKTAIKRKDIKTVTFKKH